MNTTTKRERGRWSGWMATSAWVALMLAVGGTWSTGYIPPWLAQSPHDSSAGNHRTAGPVEVYWENRYIGDRRDWTKSAMVAAAFSADGSRAYVVGSSTDGRRRHHAVTAAYDTRTGAPLWSAAGKENGGHGSQATAVAVCPKRDRVYVVGWQNGDTGVSPYVVAYAGLTGELLWQAESFNRDGASTGAKEVIVSPCGSRVFVLSRGGSGAGSLTAYDAATGDVLWNIFPRGSAGRRLPAFAGASPDGRSVFLASSVKTGSAWKWEALAVDAETGTSQWFATGPLGGGEEVRGVTVSPSGDRLFLASSTPGVDSYSRAGWTAVAVDARNGDTIWVERQSPSAEEGFFVVSRLVSGSGGRSVFLTGTRVSDRQGDAIVVVARDGATGEQLWKKEWIEKDALPIEARAVAVAPDGGSIAVAAERKSGPLPFVTIGFDAGTGATRWLVESGDAEVERAGPAAAAFSLDSKRLLSTGRSRLAGTHSAHASTYLYEITPAKKLAKKD